MRTSGRKVTPKVKNGRVQKKDRHHYTSRLGYVFDRVSPGKGWRHVVSKRDLRTFVELIPKWDSLAVGLDTVLLGEPDDSIDGYYSFFRREKTGIICLCPWPTDLWVDLDEDYVEEHSHIFDLLGVQYSEIDNAVECRFEEKQEKTYECRFNEKQAKAYSLVHVFMHELGHHHDRMTTRNQNTTPRGEEYAESFANSDLNIIWDKYIDIFKWK